MKRETSSPSRLCVPPEPIPECMDSRSEKVLGSALRSTGQTKCPSTCLSSCFFKCLPWLQPWFVLQVFQRPCSTMPFLKSRVVLFLSFFIVRNTQSMMVALSTQASPYADWPVVSLPSERRSLGVRTAPKMGQYSCPFFVESTQLCLVCQGQGQ